MFSNILVGYDGSKPADRAFRAALDLARAFSGRVRVVSVIALPSIQPDLGCELAIETERDWATNGLADLARSASGTVPVETDIGYGNPADVLLETAAAHGCDHIVVGRTGKGAVQRLLVGSVSSALAHRASVSLTLVP